MNIPVTFPVIWPTNTNVRYYFDYEDARKWIIGQNSYAATAPKTLEQFNAAFGTNYASSAVTDFVRASGLILAHLTTDTDGGGVPDLYEVYGGHWPGSNRGSRDDDIFCVCEACCRCRCKCLHWNPKECDGSTHEITGCACHGDTPPDPGDPSGPGMSENAPALLRSVLFLLCMACGACFFGSFIESFEKGSV